MLKARIVRIGYIEDGNPHDFIFDCTNGATGASYRTNGEDLWGGYTLSELEDIIENGDPGQVTIQGAKTDQRAGQ